MRRHRVGNKKFLGLIARQDRSYYTLLLVVDVSYPKKLDILDFSFSFSGTFGNSPRNLDYLAQEINNHDCGSQSDFPKLENLIRCAAVHSFSSQRSA